jgi:hypothetical protein
MKHINLYLGLVMPSSGRQSPFISGGLSHNSNLKHNSDIKSELAAIINVPNSDISENLD